jgi:hypothetical protein
LIFVHLLRGGQVELRSVAVGEAAQHALAVGIVEILFLVGAVGVPLRQVVQQIVGERAGGGVGRAAGDVAKAIVAARTEYILIAGVH